MKIKSLQLKNFKRFTDLTIEGIPENARLVLLIGSNGSGKSSVFDAFNRLGRLGAEGAPTKGSVWYTEMNSYYRKDRNNNFNTYVEFIDGSSINQSDLTSTTDYDLGKKFIGRSSIRILSTIPTETSLELMKRDLDNPATVIENDTKFINDVYAYIQEINNAIREPIFRGQAADTLKIFQNFIKPFNDSLMNIFGGDETTTIQIAEFKDATNNQSANLIFRKGVTKINYELLSHGEKQVVILLLNFIVRREYYQDKIIFIDEMDCHLNTALQATLLNEVVTKWIPDSSQLWTASHALGFIDYARKSDQAAIIDFDLLNFDHPQVLTPQPKESLDVYEIAVPSQIMFGLLSNKKLVVCENKNDEYYNLLLIKDTIFVGVKDSRDVFLHIKRDSRYHALRDRDFLSDTEIERIRKNYPNHHILRYYDFENYLYHPDNIAELAPQGFDKQGYIDEISKQKNERYDYILPTIIAARQTYEEFKTDEKLKDRSVDSIVDDFKSNEFERFYKFFDMKDQFNKRCLTAYNLSKENLVKTNWFKQQINTILYH
jgi:AAA15 family ATPase/GTPase